MNTNAVNNISFGTYLGINLQEKVLYAKSRNMFTSEQTKNLEKIENDGFFSILEIADKYQVHRQKNGKSVIGKEKCLTLGNEVNKIVIDNLKEVFIPTPDNKQLYFNAHKFIKIFNDNYNLAEKIKLAFENIGKKL